MSIFWGLVSVCFAAAACYYYWKFHENESSANVLRDQVMTLQEQRETLNSQKEEMQSNISETEAQLKTREDFLQDKETKLGQEESRLEALGAQSDNQSEQTRSQAAVVKNFNDAVRKLVQGDDTDVVVRGGRPVLRVPSSVFFDFGMTTLKPEGKALLKQIAQALDGQLDNFELRIETFTDSGGEADTTAPGAPPSTNAPTAGSGPPGDPGRSATPPSTPPNPGWVLTGKRAGVLARYLREETSLPFQNVLVVPRADYQPIIPSGPGGNARNRRIEITIAPVPAPFRPVDMGLSDAGNQAGPAPKELKVDKPVVEPAAKRVVSPAAKPADHPKTADKPAAKPKDKAVTKSSEQTAAKAPATDDPDDETPTPRKRASDSSKN